MPLPPHPGLAAIGWDPDRRRELADMGVDRLVPARILRVDRGSVLALTPDGPVRATAREPLAAGDWVALDGPRVARRLARRSEIARHAVGGRSGAQVLAANVDLLVVVCGLDRPLRPGRVRRFAALARAGGAEPVVALTKADLHPDPAAVAAGLRSALGVGALALSALTGAGLDPLATLAAPDRTLALVGESGAGKSTLTAALAGIERATRAVREGDHKGRHTTTARELVPLPGGGALVDTPGLREVGVLDLSGVEEAFADVLEVAGACRFRDCAHESEPGCAVRAAAAAGLVDPAELDRLAAMRREAAAAELRANEHELRRHGRQGARRSREYARLTRGRRD